MQNLVSLGLMARYREISKVFPTLANVKLVTPGKGPYLTPGLKLVGTRDRGPLDRATSNIW